MNSITLVELILLGLVVWRITYMFNVEDGPFDIFKNFRTFIGIEVFDELDGQRQMEILEKLQLPSAYEPPEYYADSFVGKLFACFLCLSVWVSALTTFLYDYKILLSLDFIYILLATSTISIIINKIIEGE